MRTSAAFLFLAAAGQLRSALGAPLPGVLDDIAGILTGGDGVGEIGLGTGETSDVAVTPVSQDEITSALVRPALFARSVYCSSEAVAALSCGEQCDALGDVEILKTGGDGAETPRFFVAHDKEQEAIVVAHQGTDPKKLLSDLNDIKILQVAVNLTNLPNAPDDVKIHDGFQDAQERTAGDVLNTVLSALASTGVKKVLVTGHSLGAAIATIDGMMLRMQLDESIAVTTTVFGLPRVGNQAWADLVDSTLGDNFKFVTNQNDPVPQVPPHLLDYQHPSNEIHITAVDASGQTATAQACPGQENENCVESLSLINAKKINHNGPYFANISMGNKFCTA
ncbi:alpha/beta-hydrolase [Epithele typhae]|uniref:alpha/beta-hydrolase n=1 Tax=Epithele typhae TaxID=378194 RepID=UPI002008BBE3|nr:alpha/beta-hydrolase [Epithele typhae]KAH9940517.1 alpha/beta-hydrolase [Epithele typhae]